MEASRMPSIVGSEIRVGGTADFFPNTAFAFNISAPLISLVGPNGSGKSRILKELARTYIGGLLEADDVRLLSSGRLHPIERSRSRETRSHGVETSAYVGNRHWQDHGA